MKKQLLIALLLSSSLTLPLSATLPISKQATIIDASSASEISLSATGIYTSTKRFRAKKEIRTVGVEKASKDARKAAVYFLLYSGTDPILSTEQEKQAFASIEPSFYKDDNINNFITFEASSPTKKVSLKAGKGIKITTIIKINKELLIQFLEKKSILQSKKALSNTLGNPNIMVVPQSPLGVSAIDFLQENDNARFASGVILSYLSSKMYDVILPDQQNFLNTLNNSQLNIADREEDMAYQLALSVGSDIYIDYAISQSAAAYETTKYAVIVRAFETTTGRLLGTETGHSEARKGEDQVSIEEALLAAMNNVLARVTNYWKQDIENGIQYKLIVNIQTDNFTHHELEDIQDGFFKAIDMVATKTKENIVTNRTIDYTIWCDPTDYKTTRILWQKLRENFSNNVPDASLSSINQNRKLLLLKIDK
jgi:hypothetical protein